MTRSEKGNPLDLRTWLKEMGSISELEDVIARFRRFGTAHTSVVLSSPVTDKPAAAP